MVCRQPVAPKTAKKIEKYTAKKTYHGACWGDHREEAVKNPPAPKRNNPKKIERNERSARGIL